MINITLFYCAAITKSEKHGAIALANDNGKIEKKNQGKNQEKIARAAFVEDREMRS